MKEIDITQKHSYDLDQLEIIETRLPYVFVKHTEIIFLDGVDWINIARSRVMRPDHEVSNYVDSVIGGLGDANFVGHCIFKIKLTSLGEQLSQTNELELLRILNQASQLYLLPASSQFYGTQNSNFNPDTKPDVRFFISK
jgi:hypothetical protein